MHGVPRERPRLVRHLGTGIGHHQRVELPGRRRVADVEQRHLRSGHHPGGGIGVRADAHEQPVAHGVEVLTEPGHLQLSQHPWCGRVRQVQGEERVGAAEGDHVGAPAHEPHRLHRLVRSQSVQTAHLDQGAVTAGPQHGEAAARHGDRLGDGGPVPGIVPAGHRRGARRLHGGDHPEVAAVLRQRVAVEQRTLGRPAARVTGRSVAGEVEAVHRGADRGAVPRGPGHEQGGRGGVDRVRRCGHGHGPEVLESGIGGEHGGATERRHVRRDPRPGSGTRGVRRGARRHEDVGAASEGAALGQGHGDLRRGPGAHHHPRRPVVAAHGGEGPLHRPLAEHPGSAVGHEVHQGEGDLAVLAHDEGAVAVEQHLGGAGRREVEAAVDGRGAVELHDPEQPVGHGDDPPAVGGHEVRLVDADLLHVRPGHHLSRCGRRARCGSCHRGTVQRPGGRDSVLGAVLQGPRAGPTGDGHP